MRFVSLTVFVALSGCVDAPEDTAELPPHPTHVADGQSALQEADVDAVATVVPATQSLPPGFRAGERRLSRSGDHLVLSSRMDELESLARAHDAWTPPTLEEIEANPEGSFPLLEARWRGEEGRLQGLYGGPGIDLAQIEEGGDADGAFRQFVHDHRDLWDLDEETAQVLPQLELLTDQTNKTPTGQSVRQLVYAQTWQGIPVLDGRVQVVFWDGRLDSITGRIVHPEESLVASAQLHPLPRLRQIARDAFAKDVADVPAAVVFQRAGVRIDDARYVVELEIRPDAGPDGALAPEEPHTVWLDAATGEVVVLQRSAVDGFTSYDSTFRIQRPQTNQEDPNQTNYVLDSTEMVSINTAPSPDRIYPWLDEAPAWNGYDRSPTPVHSMHPSYNWSSGQGFTWKNAPSDDFTYLAGDSRMHQQSGSFWAQRSGWVADRNFQWWPPTNDDYRESEIAVLVYHDNNPSFSGNGCPANWVGPLWGGHGLANQNPKVGCVRLTKQAGYGGDFPTLEGIFHEFGHAIDMKLLNGDMRVGTCQRHGLLEGLAGQYSLMMFQHEFGSSTAFTDYDARSGEIKEMTGTGAIDVHTDDSNLECMPDDHDDPNGTYCATGIYDRANPLHQAVWGSIHDQDCEFSWGCYNMPGNYGANQSRWALFYGMKMTDRTEGIPTFSDNYLQYLKNASGSGSEWAARWYLFTAHRLKGWPSAYESYYGDDDGPCWQ